MLRRASPRGIGRIHFFGLPAIFSGAAWLRLGWCLCAAALTAAPGGCRRDQNDKAVPAHPTTMMAAKDPAEASPPHFDDSPEGVARKFMYAWLTSDDRMMAQAIVPDARFRQLFAVGWLETSHRDQLIHQVLAEPVREFKPGDMFPVGLPGQPKELKPVPSSVGGDLKLLMLVERGLFIQRVNGRWLVRVEPIIDAFGKSYRFNPPPPPPPSTQPTSRPTRAASQPTSQPDFRM